MSTPPACPVCRSRFDEVCARVLMPAEYDPVRCSCRALLSYVVPVDTGSGLPVVERRRITR